MDTVIANIINKHLESCGVNNVGVFVKNVSQLHAGHFQGNGNTHFIVTVKSDEFLKVKAIERHKILNNAIKDFVKHHDIHSISFECKPSQ